MKMKKMRTAAALLALMLAASLSGCGDPFAEALLRNDSSLAAEIEAERAATTAPPEMKEQTFEGETTAPETEPAAASADESSAVMGAEPGTDEALAEVQLVAHQYEQSSRELDWEGFIDAYNIEMLYYMEHNELGTREDYLNFVQEMCAGKDLSASDAGTAGMFQNEPVYCPEKVDEYNQAMKTLDQMGHQTGMSNVFRVDGVYIYRIQNQAAAEAGGKAGSGMQFSFGLGEAAVGLDIAVIRINGQWKVDTTLPIMQSVLQTMDNIPSQN